MASCRRPGTNEGAGSSRVSADSMRAWTALSQEWKFGSVAVVTLTGSGARKRLQHFTFEHLDLLLGGLKALLAEARKLQATLVRSKRLLETEVAGLHTLDDALELGERLLETQLG